MNYDKNSFEIRFSIYFLKCTKRSLDNDYQASGSINNFAFLF